MSVPSGTSLGSTVARGARSLLLSQVAKIGVQLVGLVVLSRLLSPAEFGYVAIATTLIGFGEVIRDFGLSSAAIRTPNLTNRQRDVLFWLNSALGVILAGGLVALANPLADLFGTPYLASILMVLSVVFILNGITAQYRASLNRTMQFGAMAMIDAAAPLLGLVVAIVAALFGASYWALVLQLVVTAFITMVLSIAARPWLPRLPRRNSDAGGLVRFGGHMAISQLFAYAGNNVDTLALGLLSNSYSVGLYNRSFQLVMSPLNQLKSPAMSVALPALSQILDDRPRYESYLLRGQATIGYTVVPIAAVLAGASLPIVTIVLGSDWSVAAPLVSLLAIAAAAQQLASVANWIFVSKGLGRDLRNYSFVSLVLKVSAVLALAWLGPIGVATGYLLAVAVAWPIALLWATHKAGVRVAALFAQTFRMLGIGAVAGAAAFGVAWVTSSWNDVATLSLALVAAVLVYGAALVFRAVRTDVALVVQTIRMALSRRRG